MGNLDQRQSCRRVAREAYDAAWSFAARSPPRPEDLFPVWCWIDRLQERGEIPLEDALQWKVAIYGLMEVWELEPDDVVAPLLDGGDAELGNYALRALRRGPGFKSDVEFDSN